MQNKGRGQSTDFIKNMSLSLLSPLSLVSPPPKSMLADKLNMTPEEAERWIVNLIRNARLDAKIDSKLVSCFPLPPNM